MKISVAPPVAAAQSTVLKATVANVVSAVPMNAEAPIEVVELASLAIPSLPQPLNALAPRVARSGAPLMSMCVSSLSPSNAEAPMVVSELAAVKSMPRTLVHCLKAPGAMVMTKESITIASLVPQHCELLVEYLHVVLLVYVY